jgi:hypothetical protein
VNQDMLSARTRDLLRQSAEWRLLALLFDCPVAGWREQAAALAGEIGDETLAATARRALNEASEGVYHSIFGPGGPAPAREAACCESVQLGSLMSELAGYYGAFAYCPATSEAVDHISVEIGFVAYLRLKEAYALGCDNEENAAVASEAARLFIGNHLSSFTQPLAAALRNCGIGYLESAAEILLNRARPSSGIQEFRRSDSGARSCWEEGEGAECGGLCPSGR